jgi:Pyruvate/2-oxoacid:ferredoxin oxidoreductase delta subunit
MPAKMTPERRAALVKGAAKAKIKALVNLQACTGCEVCIAVCPVPSCIEKFGEDPTSFGVYVNYDICIGCMLCVKDCPWDTIRMVPSDAVASHKSSLDSQLVHTHPVFSQPELIEDPELRTFVGKPEFSHEKVDVLFGKQNPQVPNLMSPK